ncbi:MAG TPA: lysyl oxidase family protein [Candidatus Thermoplasmatota archaeon]|nr:lysyl oxidase family protein [Candidatus Thermoplasmatota archaeon]
MRGVLPAALAFAALLLASLAPPITALEDVPCGDLDGCPDLSVLPKDLARARLTRETFAADHCAVVEGYVAGGEARLLRFTTTYPNAGAGDLIVGAPSDHPDWFEWSPCHGHYHFREYADYRLWTEDGYRAWTSLRASNSGALSGDLLAANPSVAAEMVAGHKQGFCVIDVVRFDRRAGPAEYTSCSTDQGISVGWADQYSFRLDGQWIDITGLASGTYRLEVEVNAEHLFTESSYANNLVAAAVTVR